MNHKHKIFAGFLSVLCMNLMFCFSGCAAPNPEQVLESKYQMDFQKVDSIEETYGEDGSVRTVYQDPSGNLVNVTQNDHTVSDNYYSYLYDAEIENLLEGLTDYPYIVTVSTNSTYTDQNTRINSVEEYMDIEQTYSIIFCSVDAPDQSDVTAKIAEALNNASVSVSFRMVTEEGFQELLEEENTNE